MRTSIRRLNFAWLVCAFVLTGCAALQPARSFDDQLAYAYGVQTAILNAAASAREAGTLSADDGAAVLKASDQAGTFLQAAEVAANVGDLSTASAQLQLATNILTELRDYLNARVQKGAKP